MNPVAPVMSVDIADGSARAPDEIPPQRDRIKRPAGFAPRERLRPAHHPSTAGSPPVHPRFIESPTLVAMETQTPGANAFKKVAELIKEVRVAMMQTYAIDAVQGTPRVPVHIRPMYTQKLDVDTFDGELWFFTDSTSEKVAELERNNGMVLTYASPEHNRFVVVYGSGTVMKDTAKAAELWNIHAKGWWPDGPSSPSLVLIQVRVSAAEYWDGPSNASYMLSLLKAVVTGQRVNVAAEHGNVG